jgi:hypothetical protein
VLRPADKIARDMFENSAELGGEAQQVVYARAAFREARSLRMDANDRLSFHLADGQDWLCAAPWLAL